VQIKLCVHIIISFLIHSIIPFIPPIISMQMQMRLTNWAILAMFIIGLLFTMTHTSQNVQEAFEGRSDSRANNTDRCPNILIQKGSELYLHNSRIAKVPGVNPLKFNNLEEYVEFMDWQRSQGIRCPVLYLQNTFDAQGKPIYKIRPSPTDLQGGLPPVAFAGAVDENEYINKNSHRIEDADNPPMDANSYPAFDPMDPNVGSVHLKNVKGVSANPMDTNWGGDAYTKSLIAAGAYAGNEVSIRVP
jgi:hypothetical protein